MDVFSRKWKGDSLFIGGEVTVVISSPKYRHTGPGWEYEFKNGLYRSRKVTHNIVTTNGDEYYAERADDNLTYQPTDVHFTTGAAVAFDGVMDLYADDGGSGPAKANHRDDLTSGAWVTNGQRVMDSGYPKTSDADGDNTGTDLNKSITYTVTYPTSINDTGIDDVVITNPTPASSEPLLCHADGLGTLSLTTADTLKVIINHKMNGQP